STTCSDSSSSSSRMRVAAALSPGSGLPPGCMNLVVPRLRTTMARPRSSTITAALTLMSGIREHLAGVEDALRVEDAQDLPLDLPLVVAELLGEPAALQDPDPVLAGERATEADRGAEQLVGRSPDARRHDLALEDEIRMQVAVA